MRVLVAGDYSYPIYEDACVCALEKLGHDTRRFAWAPYFRGILGRAELNLGVNGFQARAMNRALIAAAEEFRPDLTLIWRGTHVLAETLQAIRTRGGSLVGSYNNDDPFSPAYQMAASLHQRRLWKTFLAALPHYDLNFVYREINIAEYRDKGGRNVNMLLPYFVPEIHYPMALSNDDLERYGSDVVFIGHYENDTRCEYIKALVRTGLHVRLFGTGWDRSTLENMADYFGEVQPVRGEEYTRALRAAKVCLAFFSKLNRDVYTRRTFEIPATGAVMLSEYSTYAARLFVDGEEAVFFRSVSEAVDHARWLCADDERREAIGRAGRKRCLDDGHDVVSRMKGLVETVEQCR